MSFSAAAVLSGSAPMDFHFDQRLALAETIPSSVYFDPATLELERRRIFHRTPQLVGRLDQVKEPGSYFTADVQGEPILVVRDTQGELRAFHNVCRHRAGPVACGQGEARVLQCGYHGWTYALDGRLLGTPDFDGVENFRRSEMGLHPVSVETWEQFIFVTLEGKPRLNDFLEDIPAQLAAFNISSMRLVARRDYVVECNWKVYVDNYVEGYHIPIVHPSLMCEIDYERYRTLTHSFYSVQDAPIKPDDEKPGRRYRPTESESQAKYFWVFPNLMLNVYPDNVSTNLILPLGANRTLTVFEWFFLETEDPRRQEVIDHTVRFGDEIQIEDTSICESVQRGLKSMSYERGRYSVKRENGLHHFHSLWYEFMSRRD